MDIALAWNPHRAAFQGYAAADLATRSAVGSAVIVSPFTDRTAQPLFAPPDGDRRGWWADAYSDQRATTFHTTLVTRRSRRSRHPRRPGEARPCRPRVRSAPYAQASPAPTAGRRSRSSGQRRQGRAPERTARRRVDDHRLHARGRAWPPRAARSRVFGSRLDPRRERHGEQYEPHRHRPDAHRQNAGDAEQCDKLNRC
ncbi:phage GP46 family protein [Siccirubricoccus deserti]|uniref:Phage GP46 family protein n=1 Tax=Siccirubricoccus deserti TaxID=2013562 RepID=A0A9X0R505_9PROT|nr:phage GP46 family protein [Siccirubricoccus deserti]